MSALHTFKVMCAAIGLPVTTPVREIPGYAIVAAETLRRAIRDTEPTEQERAEFGYPTRTTHREMEA